MVTYNSFWKLNDKIWKYIGLELLTTKERQDMLLKTVIIMVVVFPLTSKMTGRTTLYTKCPASNYE